MEINLNVLKVINITIVIKVESRQRTKLTQYVFLSSYTDTMNSSSDLAQIPVRPSPPNPFVKLSEAGKEIIMSLNMSSFLLPELMWTQFMFLSYISGRL